MHMARLRLSLDSTLRTGGDLLKSLLSQKLRRKRHLCGCDCRGQISNRRPISEGSYRLGVGRQVGHYMGDTDIGATHKQAIETPVERKSEIAVLNKVASKTADLVRRAF